MLGVTEAELAEAALLSSVADDTPEGRSIVKFAEARFPVVAPTRSAPAWCLSLRRRR